MRGQRHLEKERSSEETVAWNDSCVVFSVTFGLGCLNVVYVDLVPGGLVSFARLSPRENCVKLWLQAHLYRVAASPKAERERSTLKTITYMKHHRRRLQETYL